MELYWTLLLSTTVVSIIYLWMKVRRIKQQQKRIDVARERIRTKSDEIRRILKGEKV